MDNSRSLIGVIISKVASKKGRVPIVSTAESIPPTNPNIAFVSITRVSELYNKPKLIIISTLVILTTKPAKTIVLLWWVLCTNKAPAVPEINIATNTVAFIPVIILMNTAQITFVMIAILG